MFALLNAFYFCSSNYNKLVSISYATPFFRKPLKTLFTVSLLCKYTTWIFCIRLMHGRWYILYNSYCPTGKSYICLHGYYFFLAPCVSCTSDVCQLHAARIPHCGHPWYNMFPIKMRSLSMSNQPTHKTFLWYILTFWRRNYFFSF